MKLIKTIAALAGALSLALATTAPASAGTFQIDFTTTGPIISWSGVLPVSSDPGGVFATALFEDVDATHVKLTLSVNSGLAAGSFVNDWFFSMNASAGGVITDITNILLPDADQVKVWGVDCCKADGAGGWFDMELGFKPTELDPGDSSMFMITCAACTSLDATDFGALSAPDRGHPGGFLGAVHVQALAGGKSIWMGGGPGDPDDPVPPTDIDVPEPGSLALTALGLFGLAGMLRRRRN